MTKQRKSLSPWLCCDNCQSMLMQKDLPAHESNCPSSTETWSHSYLRNGVLYSTLECYASQVRPQHISEQEMDNLIFVAPSAMLLCEIPMGDPVVISRLNGEKIVKRAWPTDDKNLTSVSMTRKGMESSRVEGLVKVCKLSGDLYIAREIEIEYTGKQPLPKITPELDIMIKSRNEGNIFSVGNRMTVPYYGKRLSFKIVAISGDEPEVASSSSEMDVAQTEKFYKALYGTKWLIKSNNKDEESSSDVPNITVAEIGGYETLIADLKNNLDRALGKRRKIKGFKVAKGILLYGTRGVGKSAIANAVLSEYSAKVFEIKSSDFQRKIADETESRLSKIFEEAKLEAPSVIFMDDIDCLCPGKGGSSADNEKLARFLDEIRAHDVNVVVLATTSRLESVDVALRRPGRLGRRLEICTPTPKMRKEILLKLLANVPKRLSEQDIEHVASTTHGFVGEDLYGLCSDSVCRAENRFHYRDAASASVLPEDADDIAVELQDFIEALKVATPSAMKELVVEVPDVKWTDIGGQEVLKLKLKQAVEWPLRHPEVFTRLGFPPPRGLLMFGPPGCSKTMIAKALATESKLNFFNIKGPELFSKWVGDSERAVRQIFQKARQVSPSIIFIDEIDALGSERGSSGNESGGSNVQERVLAQLLTELDGVTALGNVSFVAATNRPDRIDKALLRPGRLDRIVYVPLPDADTRLDIFAIKLRKMPHAENVIIGDLVDLTEGYSGAEIEAICHEAAMKAVEEDINATVITKEHFKAALSIVTPRTPPSLIKMYEDYINSHK